MPIPGCMGVKESEGVTLRLNNLGVSVQDFSGASHSSSSRDIRKLDKNKEEESCACTCLVIVGKMADFSINLLLEIVESIIYSNSFSKDAETGA